MSNNKPEALRLARMTDKQRLPEVGGKPDAATEALRHKMMGGDKQPNALALADALETFHNPHDKQAAAELRRLHNEVRVLTECYRLDGARDIALLRQALEALEAALSDDQPYILQSKEAVSALRAALAEQPAQQHEPVVFYRCNGCGHAYEQVHPTSCDCMEAGGFDRVEYYTSPPAQRKPLTDEEIYECERIAAIRHHRHKNSIRGQQITPADDPQWHFARAIERAHGIGEHE